MRKFIYCVVALSLIFLSFETYSQPVIFKTGDTLVLQTQSTIFSKPKTTSSFYYGIEGSDAIVLNDSVVNKLVLIKCNDRIGYIRVNDLHIKTENVVKSTPKNDLLLYSDKSTLTPGSYLVKSGNQILSGIGLGFAGAIVTSAGIVVKEKTGRNTDPFIAIGMFSALTGIMFEISGIVNIKRAGIAFNKNGIGVSIPLSK